MHTHLAFTQLSRQSKFNDFIFSNDAATAINFEDKPNDTTHEMPRKHLNTNVEESNCLY
jgi:hypothetical protein